jgi:hypothetical protein
VIQGLHRFGYLHSEPEAGCGCLYSEPEGLRMEVSAGESAAASAPSDGGGGPGGGYTTVTRASATAAGVTASGATTVGGGFILAGGYCEDSLGRVLQALAISEAEISQFGVEGCVINVGASSFATPLASSYPFHIGAPRCRPPRSFQIARPSTPLTPALSPPQRRSPEPYIRSNPSKPQLLISPPPPPRPSQPFLSPPSLAQRRGRELVHQAREPRCRRSQSALRGCMHPFRSPPNPPTPPLPSP